MMNRFMFVATLVAAWGASTVANAAPFILFSDDFDSTPVATKMDSGLSSGYVVVGRLSEGPTNPVAEDHTVIFGYDYGVLPVPTSVAIPSAPNSSGGTTKGLYITTNKGTTPGTTAGSNTRTAVNVYPVDGLNLPRSFSGNYSLKFDLWQNWGSGATITAPSELSLYGINHSGTAANIYFSSVPTTSDGLFYAQSANGRVPTPSTGSLDFAVHQGAGATFAALKTSGFISQLGPNFDNLDPGYSALFPARAAFPTMEAGSAGNQWNQIEVRQEDGVISQYISVFPYTTKTLITQYANTTGYTAGDIMLGYWDYTAPVGQPDHYAIFDNIRVCAVPEPTALALGGIAAAVLGAFVRRRKS